MKRLQAVSVVGDFNDILSYLEKKREAQTALKIPDEHHLSSFG